MAPAGLGRSVVIQIKVRSLLLAVAAPVMFAPGEAQAFGGLISRTIGKGAGRVASTRAASSVGRLGTRISAPVRSWAAGRGLSRTPHAYDASVSALVRTGRTAQNLGATANHGVRGLVGRGGLRLSDDAASMAGGFPSASPFAWHKNQSFFWRRELQGKAALNAAARGARGAPLQRVRWAKVQGPGGEEGLLVITRRGDDHVVDLFTAEGRIVAGKPIRHPDPRLTPEEANQPLLANAMPTIRGEFPQQSIRLVDEVGIGLGGGRVSVGTRGRLDTFTTRVDDLAEDADPTTIAAHLGFPTGGATTIAPASSVAAVPPPAAGPTFLGN